MIRENLKKENINVELQTQGIYPPAFLTHVMYLATSYSIAISTSQANVLHPHYMLFMEMIQGDHLIS